MQTGSGSRGQPPRTDEQGGRVARGALLPVKGGLTALEAGELSGPGARLRQGGAGRKKLLETDATLLADLAQEREPKGAPRSWLGWPSKSFAQLVGALAAPGHASSKAARAQVLHAPGGSLRATPKPIAGKALEDPDAQFAHLNRTCKECEQNGAPLISLACKKQELLGRFKTHGRAGQAKGEETDVNGSDFLSLAAGAPTR